jgi:DNA-binding beta-propeller fold protein YncE
VIDRDGHLVTTLQNATLLDGPWDLTVLDLGIVAQVFVSNVLNGTVTRLNLFLGGGSFHLLGSTQIAHGYAFATNSSALVVGPTGLAYNVFTDTLYVASTADNAIFAISRASVTNQDVKQGQLIYQDSARLHGPLGLVLAPNGDLITANGDAINAGGTQNALVEFTQEGKFVAQFQIDSGAPGAAFGIALSSNPFNPIFAAVDDDQNQLDIWNVK